jgi:hypothetical protein
MVMVSFLLPRSKFRLSLESSIYFHSAVTVTDILLLHIITVLLHLKHQTISVNLPMPGACWGREKYNKWAMSDGTQTHWRMDQDYCGVKWNISVTN